MNRSLRKYQKLVSEWLNQKYESMFPSQTTTRLMNILGASTLIVGGIRRHGRPMTIVLWRGKLLRSEHYKLTFINGVPALSNDLRHAILLEDDELARDILVQQAFDEQLANEGFIVRWIPARWLDQRPAQVKQSVSQFIYS